MKDEPEGINGPHVFVDCLERLELRDEDRSHLERSLRLRPGDSLTASDGAGSWRLCRFGTGLEAAGPVSFVPSSSPSLTIGFAVTKNAKPELVVQKLTEIGIDSMIPFMAERSIPIWGPEKEERHHERFQRLVREAAMQSRRVWVPRVEGLKKYEDFSGATRAERGGAKLNHTHTTVLIGPEGGWSRSERSEFPSVHLGPHILRSDTAAIAAGVLMVQMRSEGK